MLNWTISSTITIIPRIQERPAQAAMAAAVGPAETAEEDDKHFTYTTTRRQKLNKFSRLSAQHSAFSCKSVMIHIQFIGQRCPVKKKHFLNPTALCKQIQITIHN
jgi:hypothetical protein